MDRPLTLYRDCGRDDCEENRYHMERKACLIFNDRGLCTRAQHDYKFKFRKEPKPSFYDLTSHYDGDNISIYTRKQLFDTILNYRKRLHPKFRGGHCYFFPYYRFSTDDYQSVTVFGEKVPMTENDIKYHEKWFKQVVSFFREYFRNHELMLSVCD